MSGSRRPGGGGARRLRLAAIAAIMVSATSIAAAGCGSEDDPNTVTVFAAASLKTVFTQMGADFEKNHPGVTVEFSFAGSSDLVAQLQGGAVADVIATADEATMGKLAAPEALVGAQTVFATNVLEIAVAPGNPRHIGGLTDLTAPGLAVVVCAAPVPCGAAAAAVTEGIELRPVSEEQSVTDVLAKVSSGNADAGLVYATDVEGSKGAVTGVEFPESAAHPNRYPIALIDGKNPNTSERADAQDFIDYVLADGQKTLQQAGFGAP